MDIFVFDVSVYFMTYEKKIMNITEDVVKE